ncbi:MAG: hypothetical protein IJH04_08375 [Eggerthellaceae bacterium]|nr:hypothetical protein [Eggerthellaceae bacterium]
MSKLQCPVSSGKCSHRALRAFTELIYVHEPAPAPADIRHLEVPDLESLCDGPYLKPGDETLAVANTTTKELLE